MGIEAAHIKWHQVGGPDIVPNGIALCSLHHKMFDLGGFTVLRDRTLVVSEEVSGGQRADGLLRAFHGERLAETQRVEYQPGEEFVEWHQKERFKKPGIPV
jgi:putative restriction endonuclease